MEMWERLNGRDREYEVSDSGRVRLYKTKQLVPLDTSSVRAGRPAVLIRDELRLIKGLVARAFGNEVAAIAAVAALGEEALLARRVELEEEMEQVDQALASVRTRLIEEHLRVPPENSSRPLSCKDYAIEEARALGAVYRAGVAQDPVSGLSRAEIESRLRRLRGIYGSDIENASQIAFFAPDPRGTTTFVL